MATVVQVEDANVENIDFIRLKKTFYTNFLLLKWKNETKVYVILNLLEVSAYSIKGMFYEVSSDYFVKHRTQFNVFLSLDTHTFVCHQDKLYKMVKLLHKRISENTYVTAFMRFSRDSLSFKTEKRNKNDDAKCQFFAAKLFNEMQRCKHLCGTEKYISDKSVCSADSTNGKNKTCSLYKLDDSLYNRKKKTLSPRKSEDSQNVFILKCSVVDVTRKSEDSQNVFKPRCSVVDVTRKSEDRQNVFKTRCNVVDVTRKSEDNQSVLKPRCNVVDVTRKSEDSQNVFKPRCSVVDLTRKSEDSQNVFKTRCNVVDVTRKSEDNQNVLKPRCNVVDVTRKSEDSQNVFKTRCNVVPVSRKSEDIESFDLVAISGVTRTRKVNLTRSLPLNRMIPDLPPVPEPCQATGRTEIPSSMSANVNENNVRSDTQSRSHVDEQHSKDSTNSPSGNNPVITVLEEYEHSSNLGQAISHDGTSRNILASDMSQNDSRSEICIDGSSYNRTGQFHFSGGNSGTNFRLPPPAVVQQNRTFLMGHIGGSTSGQQQQYQQQNRETTFSELATYQAIPQQRNGNDDLLRDLGRVRSPEYADLTVRLGTFTRWPSDIAQTSAKVAEAGFYHTGFQDTVRCFVCDGGLKNWDPDDDPWIEHARWFPQCAYVRHIKGEEFINLVRMSTEESDEEDDNTVHTGATWGGAQNSNTSADSASHEIAEPSVLESKDAQCVIEMGFSKKVVAMAINDIFKKGKEDFTSQEITDIILEKDMLGEPSNSMLAVDCPPTIENVSPTEHATFENKRLKELLQCTECKSRQRNILFLPCTHHVVCELCSRDLHICTYCYRKIKDKVRTYMS